MVTVFSVQCQPDAGAAVQPHPLHLEGPGQNFADASDSVLDNRRIGEGVKEDRKLLPTQAGNGVGLAQGRGQPRPDLPQQR